jgi:ketosteroid isomerase-like protein
MMALIALLLIGTVPDVATPSPRTVVGAMFDAFNRHDAAGTARLYAPDARLTSPDFCTVRGQGDVERIYATLFAAFPDIHDEVQEMIVEGDLVAVRFVAVSQKGGLSLPIQAMIRVREGKIVTDDSLFDAGGKACER